MDKIDVPEIPEGYAVSPSGELYKPDIVNHPDHYTTGGIEVYDFLKAKLTKEELKGYLKGNIIKYISRAEYKGEMEQDYAKAKWYQDRLNEIIGTN